MLRGISGGVCDVRDPEFIGVCDGSSDFSVLVLWIIFAVRKRKKNGGGCGCGCPGCTKGNAPCKK
ncbi:MAG: FeoB-associated Cys-rich membrane protein [Oscillospiraceae bacterium]